MFLTRVYEEMNFVKYIKKGYNIIWALKQMKHGKLKLLFGRLKI